MTDVEIYDVELTPIEKMWNKVDDFMSKFTKFFRR